MNFLREEKELDKPHNEAEENRIPAELEVRPSNFIYGKKHAKKDNLG
jgi:hypothetical protein